MPASTILRAALVLASLGTTAAAAAIFYRMLSLGGVGVLDLVLMVLFCLLFLWIALSFWTALAGAMQLLRKDRFSLFPLHNPTRPLPPGHVLPRTAVVMPIYNEDPVRVFAGIRAMHGALQHTGRRRSFDFFVLSDTTDPDTWLREERALQHTLTRLGPDPRVFYRRRLHNVGRKSGNLQEFCERWGRQYEHMIVLDADSVMAGDTMVEMVRRMEEDPGLGILQVPPKPVNRDSLFARCQQFAASVYAELFTAGFALWTHTDGNYYGHNAIIRIQPFIEHCGLPTLSGPPPMGGEILSHDFVEAALMRRAGWTVKVAWDLGGSYEESPTRLIDYAKRDQRWCQGNLQHLRVIPATGLHPVSRLHLVMGVMSYLASPLWLVFMVIGGLNGVMWNTGVEPGGSVTIAGVGTDVGGFVPAGPDVVWQTWAWGVALFVLTMVLLMLPRLLAFALLMREKPRLMAHGNDGRAAVSLILEIAVSVLVAPILMIFHSVFVVSTLTGHTVSWSAQRRDDSATHATDAWVTYRWHTLIGIAVGVLCWYKLPGLFWWLSPVLAGLVLSIPLALMLDSPTLGKALRRWGLLLIPEETNTPEVLRDQRRFVTDHAGSLTDGPADPLTRVVIDPAFHAMHLALLQADHGPPPPDAPADRHWNLRQVFLHGGATYLKREDKLTLLCDPASLRWLHEQVWTTWPVEKLQSVTG